MVVGHRETEKIERERQEMELIYKAEQEKKRHEVSPGPNSGELGS